MFQVWQGAIETGFLLKVIPLRADGNIWENEESSSLTPHLWNPIGKYYIFIWKPWHGEIMRNASNVIWEWLKLRPRKLGNHEFYRRFSSAILLWEQWPDCLIRTLTCRWRSLTCAAQNMMFLGLGWSWCIAARGLVQGCVQPGDTWIRLWRPHNTHILIRKASCILPCLWKSGPGNSHN